LSLSDIPATFSQWLRGISDCECADLAAKLLASNAFGSTAQRVEAFANLGEYVPRVMTRSSIT
jgi:hypothetical protein